MKLGSSIISIPLCLCAVLLSLPAFASADDAPAPDATVTVTADRPEPEPGSSSSGSDNGVDPNDLNSPPSIRTLNNTPNTPNAPPTRGDPCADEVAAMREFTKRAESILRPLRLEMAILLGKGLSSLALKFEQDVYKNSVNSTYGSDQYGALQEALFDCLDEYGLERHR